MNVEDIVGKFYDPASKLYDILIQHGRDVADMAAAIAENLKTCSIDMDFIIEASMLHDIGIFLVDLPELHCYGPHPYICHGYLGRELLEKEGFPKHGLVCERHVGTGISKDDIKKYKLPLPLRDMVPVSMEEQIICYADKFFSKSKNGSSRKKSFQKIISQLEVYGRDKAVQFQSWAETFNTIRASENHI